MEKASEQESLAPSYWLVMMWKQRNTNLFVRYENVVGEKKNQLGTGFSEENLKEYTEFFKDNIVNEKPIDYKYIYCVELDSIVWIQRLCLMYG